MMGLSSMGSGGGNSSASDLSASAPPFTVDRLNPKPNSNPLLHYSDWPYVVDPFSHPSQYAHLSAHRVEPAIDSTKIISVPVSDGYRFSSSASAVPSSTQWSAHNSAYGGDAKPPYYNPNAPPLAGDANLLAENEGSRYNVTLTSELGVTSQHDHTRSFFNLEYGPHWEDSFILDDAKKVKRSEFGGNFSSEKQYVAGSHGYENQPYRGGCGHENRNKFKEDSSVLYKTLNQVSDREVHTGSLSTGYMEDMPCFEQQVGFFRYDSNETLLTTSSSSYLESYPSIISCAMQQDFPNYQNSCSPYEKCVRPFNSPFPGRISVTGSSTVVIRPPPPTTNWNLGQGAASRKPTGILTVNSNYTNPSKPNDFGLKPCSKPKDDFFETSLFKFSKQRNTPDSSFSLKELSSPLVLKDASDCKIKATFESQMPDVNVSTGFNLTGGNIEVVNSIVDSSELIDHHNTAVDSPCWRGAPSSQFSVFDIEAGNSNHVEIKLDELYGFDHGEHQNYLSTIDSNSVLSEKVEFSMGNKNKCGKTCEILVDEISSITEQNLLDGTRDRVWIPSSTRSKGVELSCSPDMVTKELNLPNNSTSVYDMQVSDTKHLFAEDGSGMTVNDVSEGAAVAVHAAEKVLASPVSQEDATEQITAPDPGLDVPVIVKTIHNLSELLRFHISSDVCSLGEENTEILKHAISSLNSCLSKKGTLRQAANNPEPKDPVGETSGILGKSSNMGIISGDLHTKCEASNSCIKPDCLHFQKGEQNCILPGKKDEILPITSPLREHITGDDDMTKALKKVLEQNFHINEDMPSQALLFKSLWLESEAKLCSISYKARFERTKIQMEEINLKASKASVYEDIAEMTSEHCMSPDLIRVPEAHGGTFLKPTSPKNSACDGIEASVLARFNILKCQEENPKPITTEKQQESEMVGGKHADTTVMARFNILKSREENSKLINMEEEKPPQVEFAGEKYLIRVEAEDGALNLGLQPDFQCAAGSGSYFESPIFKSGSMSIDGNNSPSSEWEHVLKEDFSLKN